MRHTEWPRWAILIAVEAHWRTFGWGPTPKDLTTMVRRHGVEINVHAKVAHLRRSGLLESPDRGTWRLSLTPAGLLELWSVPDDAAHPGASSVDSGALPGMAAVGPQEQVLAMRLLLSHRPQPSQGR